MKRDASCVAHGDIATSPALSGKGVEANEKLEMYGKVKCMESIRGFLIYLRNQGDEMYGAGNVWSACGIRIWNGAVPLIPHASGAAKCCNSLLDDQVPAPVEILGILEKYG